MKGASSEVAWTSRRPVIHARHDHAQPRRAAFIAALPVGIGCAGSIECVVPHRLRGKLS
jgi:hypothetical protein